MPISWQSVCRWLTHEPSGRLPLLSTRPTFTFPAKETLAWSMLNNTVWWQRHTGVSSLPKATTWLCPARTWTCRRWITSPMMPPYHRFCNSQQLRENTQKISLQQINWPYHNYFCSVIFCVFCIRCCEFCCRYLCNQLCGKSRL